MKELENIPKKEAIILLVEDEAADIKLIQRALRSNKVMNEMSIVTDGEMAMDYLYQRNGFKDAPRPDLILLDLNLPKKSGQQVIAEIKEDEDLKRIPIAVMTSSDMEEDVLRSYNLGCNCYVKKPLDLKEIEKVVDCLQEFWLKIVVLPPNPSIDRLKIQGEATRQETE